MRDIILATGASPTNNVAGLDDTSKIHFVYVFNYSIKTTDNGTLGITLQAGYKSLIFVDCIYKDVAHEIGHILSLKHTFDPPAAANSPLGGGYLIPKYSTKNYMDYPSQYGDLSNMFYFSDWVEIY